MKSNIIGLFLYYWIFIIGALFALKFFGLNDNAQIIPILGAITAFYFAFQFIRGRAMQRKDK